MIKTLLFFVVLILMPISFVLATPPTSIDLKYDLKNQSLHVEAAHETQDLLKNYVRLMNVYVNGNQVASKDYHRQDDYEKFTDDVAFNAQVGDDIKVDLFCFSGGELAKDMTVAADNSSN